MKNPLAVSCQFLRKSCLSSAIGGERRLLFGRYFLLMIEEDFHAVRPAKGDATAAVENTREPLPVRNFFFADETIKRNRIAAGFEILHLISGVSARDVFSEAADLAPTNSLAAPADEITVSLPS